MGIYNCIIKRYNLVPENSTEFDLTIVPKKLACTFSRTKMYFEDGLKPGRNFCNIVGRNHSGTWFLHLSLHSMFLNSQYLSLCNLPNISTAHFLPVLS